MVKSDEKIKQSLIENNTLIITQLRNAMQIYVIKIDYNYYYVVFIDLTIACVFFYFLIFFFYFWGNLGNFPLNDKITTRNYKLQIYISIKQQQQ